MFKLTKNLFVKFISVFMGLFFFIVLTSFAVADENYVNVPNDSNMMMEMSESESGSESMSLPFDPNNYRFLVYDPCGNQSSIRQAMKKIIGRDLTPGEIRTYKNPVTPNDLSTHDILIVGWNYDGNTSGLHSDDLLAGITGRVILTGHDLDYHTANGPTEEIAEAAQTMLIQAINYVLQGGGTGLITLGDLPYSGAAFSYLPKQVWDVNAVSDSRDDVNSFTLQGLASGVFDGLEPSQMSNWGQSYHDTFTIGPNSVFVQFELGGDDGNDIITVARINTLPPGCEVTLTKTDDISGCVEPNNFINYQICYSTTCDINDVNIIDTLPAYVDFNDANGGGIYNEPNHTVTWNLGHLEANDSNCFTIKVKVAEDANGGSTLTNTVKMYSGGTIIKTALPEQTQVCCYAPVVYVDINIPASGNGRSWQTAYKELRNALTNVRDGNCGCADQIWAKKGTYKPTEANDTNPSGKTFAMISGKNIYGHFDGNETSIEQRNLAVQIVM